MKNGSYSKKITPQSVLDMKQAQNANPSLWRRGTSLILLLSGLFFCTMSKDIDLIYNSKNSQDVYTTGMVMSKWDYWKRRKGSNTHYYKIGIIYALNPNQPISSTMLQKVKEFHDRRLRSRNVDIEKFRQLSKLYAKSNNIKQEDVFYGIMDTDRATYKHYNVNDVIKLEYLRTKPWSMEDSLDAYREMSQMIFLNGVMLFLFGSLLFFIESFDVWKRNKIQ